MSEGIKIALIGGGATVIAAIIGLIGKKIGAKRTNVKIKQVSKGGDSVQIGIQKKQFHYWEDSNHGKHSKH